MYNLIKITSSGVNVPEHVRLTLATEASLERAMPFYLENGALVPVTAATTHLPTHMTVKAVDGKDVLCYEILPQMVFSVKASGDPTAMTIGTEYVLSENGESVTSTKVSGSVRGAVLLSENGAKTAGDEIFVSFR